MIKLVIFWTLPFILIVTIQYGVGEKYFIDRLKRNKTGYMVVAGCLLLSIAYGVYVMQFVEFMEALGIAQLIISSVLFYRFFGRYSKAGHI